MSGVFFTSTELSHWSTWRSLRFWKQVLRLEGGLPSQKELMRTVNGTTTQEKEKAWEIAEDIEGAQRLLCMMLLGMLACVPSMFTGIWCYPSFFTSVVTPTLPRKWWLTMLVPTNIAIFTAYHFLVAAVQWQDLYQGVVNLTCWVLMTAFKRRVTWGAFQASLVCQRDWKLLGEKHMAFHKMLTSVFDAWCFCDPSGLISSGTPQLHALLENSVCPEADSLRGLRLSDFAASEAERARAESFLQGVARSGVAGKITLSLNQKAVVEETFEVVLTAVALSRASGSVELDGGRIRTPSDEDDITEQQAEREVTLFVTMHAYEGEPIHTVSTDFEEFVRSLDFVDSREGAGVVSTEFDEENQEEQEQPDDVVAEGLGRRERRTRFVLPEVEGHMRVRNTFVEVAESEAGSVFQEALAHHQLPRALSSPAVLGADQASSPSARSAATAASLLAGARSALDAVSVARAPPSRKASVCTLLSSAASAVSAARRSAPPSRVGSAIWASSAASVGSTASGEATEVLLGCVVQERSVRGGPQTSSCVNLGPALLAGRRGLASLGSCHHADGRCYPCLIEAWRHEGRTAAPCKFGRLCGRCHEPHQEADLKSLRRRAKPRRQGRGGGAAVGTP